MERLAGTFDIITADRLLGVGDLLLDLLQLLAEFSGACSMACWIELLASPKSLLCALDVILLQGLLRLLHRLLRLLQRLLLWPPSAIWPAPGRPRSAAAAPLLACALNVDLRLLLLDRDLGLFLRRART